MGQQLPKPTIKVRVVMTVEVSPTEWNLIYGSDEKQADIRESIRYAARGATEYDLGSRGLTVKVEAEGVRF